MRRISLLTHLLEEIREFRAQPMDDAALAASATSDDVDVESSWLSDLVGALRATKRLLSLTGNFRSKSSSMGFMLFFVCACVCM
nr:u-box domain-containing protein 11 [Quercus suber]